MRHHWTTLRNVYLSYKLLLTCFLSLYCTFTLWQKAESLLESKAQTFVGGQKKVVAQHLKVERADLFIRSTAYTECPKNKLCFDWIWMLSSSTASRAAYWTSSITAAVQVLGLPDFKPKYQNSIFIIGCATVWMRQ